MQKHHELHVALSPEDVELYVLSGLPEMAYEGQTCSHCGVEVGPSSGKFIALAFVLDADHHHALCLSCAAPVIRT